MVSVMARREDCNLSTLLNTEPTSAMYDQSFEDMELSTEKWKGKTSTHVFPSSRSILNFYLTELVFQEVSTFTPHQIPTPIAE